jgi:hypothetical protein
MFKFRLMVWIAPFLFLFAACTQSDPLNSNEEPAVIETTQAAATAVPTGPTPEPTADPTETPASVAPIVETAVNSSPQIDDSDTTTGSGAKPANLITAEPIFTGGDLQFAGWSPDGRYLAYFEYTEEQVAESPVEGLRGTYPGTFVFYDTQTGEKCTDYPISGFFGYEGSGSGAQWRWLPDGQMLISLPDGQLLQTEAPCEPGENIAALFPNPISSIGSLSPNESVLQKSQE